MKSVAIATTSTVLVGGALFAPSAVAAPTPSDTIVRAAIKVFWNDMEPSQRRKICRAFWIVPSKTVNVIARPVIRGGAAPAYQIKPILRQFLVRAC